MIQPRFAYGLMRLTYILANLLDLFDKVKAA